MDFAPSRFSVECYKKYHNIFIHAYNPYYEIFVSLVNIDQKSFCINSMLKFISDPMNCIQVLMIPYLSARIFFLRFYAKTNVNIRKWGLENIKSSILS